jgi:hypothetical protein
MSGPTKEYVILRVNYKNLLTVVAKFEVRYNGGYVILGVNFISTNFPNPRGAYIKV